MYLQFDGRDMILPIYLSMIQSRENKVGMKFDIYLTSHNFSIYLQVILRLNYNLVFRGILKNSLRLHCLDFHLFDQQHILVVEEISI